MGREICRAVDEAEDLELVACVDPAFAEQRSVGPERPSVQTSPGLEAFESTPLDVVVDFSIADAARVTVPWCASRGIHVVVGTTGFSAEDLVQWRNALASGGANGIVASNFAIGAILMMKLAEIAAPHFDGVEVIELHHDNKRDAPSGTALATVERVDAARRAAGRSWPADPTQREVASGARGARVKEIPVHSVRLRGLVAHQEVLFGAIGQTLSIRHDTYDRASFMPGVLLAVRKVQEVDGLLEGLESLLWP